MMGSRVHAADMTLEDALAVTDDTGRQRAPRRCGPPARPAR